MEVKVKVGLDSETKEIAWAFINKLGAPFKDIKPVKDSTTKPVETLNEREMAEDVAITEELVDPVKEKPDYSALRNEIKRLGIKLVQAKKQAAVKALTAKYGCAKISDIPDEKLESYLEELKEV